MPSRISTDPDMKVFATKLQQLPLGKQYLKSWSDLLTIQKRLSMVRAYPHVKSESIIELRRHYHTQLVVCDQILDLLYTKYNWPVD